MEKGIFSLGYQNYILDLDDAVAVMRLLARAERYASKWHRGENGNDSTTTHHVWDEPQEAFELKIIPENTYRMAKLAGEPKKD